MLDDSDVRREAVESVDSILLRAPAGSGKTTVLVQRLLVLLTRVARPEQVLAITFTRKAAAEMRERVLAALAFANGAQPVPATANDSLRRTIALAQETLRHATRQGWELMQNPAQLRIQTIESLNHWIATQLPASAGTGDGDIVEQPLGVYRDAARQALDLAAHDPALREQLARLLRLVENRWNSLEEEIAELLAQRHRWWRHLGKMSFDQQCGEIARCLERLSVAAQQRAQQAIGTDFLQRAARVLQDTARERIARGEQDPDWVAWGTPRRLQPLPELLPMWRLLGRFFLTEKNELRSRFPSANGLPGVAEQHKGLLRELADELKLRPGARAVLAALKELPHAELSPDSRSALQALRALLPLAAAALEELMTAQGLRDLVAVAGRARQALSSDSEPTEFALRLGESLRHILVDEYQDTSIDQFELLQNLTLRWADGDGRSVLLVGDPMQSIYGFRDAEVALFLRARCEGLGELKLKYLELHRNFRSRAGIVEFVNHSFAPLMPQQDDLQAGQAVYSGAVAARTDGAPGEVRFHLLVRGAGQAARDLEAERILALVAELREASPQGSVAILTQTRNSVAGLTEMLRDRGWPVRGVKMVALADLPAIQDLNSLAQALLDPLDRIAWLAVLRAPWCAASLDVLEELARSAGQGAIALALQHALDHDAWPAGAAARLRSVTACLLAGLAAVTRDGIAAAVSATWSDLGGPACMGADARLRDAESYLDRLAIAAASRDWRGRHSLATLTQDLYAEAGPDTKLEILPIHQAKGLEYDHVILTGLAVPWSAETRRLLAWREIPGDDGAPADLVLAARPDPAAAGSDGVYAFLMKLAGERAAQEKLRLMYVAATRARESLHWVASLAKDDAGEWRLPPANSTLRLLWPVLADRMRTGDSLDRAAMISAAAPTAAPAVVGLTPEPRRLRRLPDDWQVPAADAVLDTQVRTAGAPRPEQEPEFDWAGIESRHVGTVLHAALQRIAVSARERGALPTGLPHDPLWAAELRALGVAPVRIARAASRIGNALRATLKDETGRWILDPAHAEAQCEQAHSGLLDGELAAIVVDRYFVDRDGQRWVIDYKSGQHLGGKIAEFLENEKRRYQPQMDRYCRLLAQKGPPVRAALYFPMMQQIVIYG